VSDIDDARVNVGSILKKLSEALNAFATITVQTFETSFDVDADGNLVPTNPAAGAPKPRGVKTEINLLTADIKFMRSPDLAADVSATLQAIHEQHVVLSQQIFRDNLKFVVDTVQKLV
jgi:hypothetical protein